MGIVVTNSIESPPAVKAGNPDEESRVDVGGWLHVAKALFDTGLGLPPRAFHSEVAPWIARCVAHVHPDGADFRSLTAEALVDCGYEQHEAERLAGDVLHNYLRSHYVDKMLVSRNPTAALSLCRGLLTCGDLSALSGHKRGSVVCSLHFSSYPLLPLAFAANSLPVVFLRARPDIMERGNDADGKVVYASDRLAPVKLVRALNEGKHIFIMADQLDGNAETATVSLFGRPLKVNIGLAWLARKAEASIVPVVLQDRAGAVCFDCLPPIPAGPDLGEVMQHVFRSFEKCTAISPQAWIARYTLLNDERAQALRNRLKRSNDLLWNRLVN